MEFTKEQRRDLDDALRSAFNNEKELALVLERDLDVPLNSIVQNAQTFDETVWEVVKWAEREGVPLISNLIIYSSLKHPGNLKLQDFVFTNIYNLLGHAPDYLDEDSLANFVDILRNSSNVSPLVDALFQAQGVRTREREIRAHKKMAVDFLGKDSDINAIKIFFILQILQSYPGENQKFPGILEFANILAQNASLSNSIRQELNEWVQAAKVKFGFQIPVEGQSDNQPEPYRKDVTDVSLMLLISGNHHTDNTGKSKQPEIEKREGDGEPKQAETKEPQSDCVLKAYLQTYQTTEGKSLFCEQVDIDFGQASSPNGKPCYFAEIEQDIKPLIQKSAAFIIEHFDGPPSLIVEVFLPLPWMSEKVDLWKTGAFREEIGRQYPLVVRSSERYLLSQPRYLFSKFWKDTCQPLLVCKSEPSAFLRTYISHIDSAEEYREAKKLKKKVAIKITYPPPKGECNRFFQSLIAANIPFAVWVRCEAIKEENWKDVLHTFCTWSLLKNKLKLLEQIQQKREDACAFMTNPEEGLGYHLSVLADDPDRVPEALQLDSHEV